MAQHIIELRNISKSFGSVYALGGVSLWSYDAQGRVRSQTDPLGQMLRYVYDGQGRLIDVRGLPPGTEAECPYTHRTFLVPP